MAQIANPPKAQMTWEEFLAAGEEWQRWELVDGEVEFMSPTGYRHAVVIRRLCAQLDRYCQTHPVWTGGSADAAFRVVPGGWRCPDATLVRVDRFPDRTIPVGPVEFPPDVAFEVYSPGDSAARTARKRRDYQASGVIQVWIDAEKREAEVVHPDGTARRFAEQQPLEVKGIESLALDLKAIFEL